MAELPKTWEDWVANFGEWQDRVGFNREWLGDFDLSILFDWDRTGDTIEFGDYAGRAKWERALQVLVGLRSHRAASSPFSRRRPANVRMAPWP